MMRKRLLVVLLVGLASAAHGQQMDQTKPMAMQAGHLGAMTMPFDLSRSRHIFTPSADGGTQDVVSLDRDSQQIAIRMHLQHEAAAFAAGNYADPAAIHGDAMPGLVALRTGAARIHVTFETVEAGGRIRFTCADPDLVQALHAWFQAQVHDHGGDAVMNSP